MLFDRRVGFSGTPSDLLPQVYIRLIYPYIRLISLLFSPIVSP